MTGAAHEDRDIATFSQEQQDQNDMAIISLQESERLVGECEGGWKIVCYTTGISNTECVCESRVFHRRLEHVAGD